MALSTGLNPDNYPTHSGRVVGEDGNEYNILSILGGIGAGGAGSTGSATGIAYSGTALPSAARTAATNSIDFNSNGCRGIHVILRVSAASGTGGLTVRLQGLDPASSQYYTTTTLPAAVTAVGTWNFEFYPGATAGGTDTTNSGNTAGRYPVSLPRTWRILINHGDATSYTYSVGYHLIP